MSIWETWFLKRPWTTTYGCKVCRLSWLQQCLLWVRCWTNLLRVQMREGSVPLKEKMNYSIMLLLYVLHDISSLRQDPTDDSVCSDTSGRGSVETSPSTTQCRKPAHLRGQREQSHRSNKPKKRLKKGISALKTLIWKRGYGLDFLHKWAFPFWSLYYKLSMLSFP